jgi:hypothetical protein
VGTIHLRKSTRDMDGSVVQDKNVCGTCGVKFTRHRNLRRHEETQHPDDQNPEAVVENQKRQEGINTRIRNRRIDDPVFREKLRYQSQMNRINKKARVEPACDVATSSATETDQETGPCEAIPVALTPPPTTTPTAENTRKKDKPGSPVRVTTTALTTAPSTTALGSATSDAICTTGTPAAGRCSGFSDPTPTSKKHRKKDNPKGSPFQTTIPLTVENVTSFFAPKYKAARSKEQRAANPRPPICGGGV